MLRVKFVTEKASMLYIKFSPKKAPLMLSVKFVLKKAPMLCVTFSPKRAPMLSVKFLHKKAPMLYALNCYPKSRPSMLWVQFLPKKVPMQWRSEGGHGGICPRAPPGGVRQNPAKDFFKIYIRRNFNNSERKQLKCSHFFL